MNNTENTFDHDPNDDFTQFYTSAQGTTLAPGEFLGEHRNYRLEKKLGEGGMAQVWLATEIEGGKELRKVVCKLLPRPVQTDSKSLEQIEKVFALTQGLNHPNICPIYGMKSDPTYGWFFVMGYADGLTLEKWFQEQSNAQNGLPLPKVLEILKPLASALDFAHKKGIIHRDVKPQNAMFTGEDQTLWLLDFGIASKIHSTMTATIGARATSGTPHFMAPEQCQGKFQDGRTDQYALATLAYLLLSGHTPFEGDSFTLWGQIVNQSPEPISKLSSAANSVLLKALAKDRNARFTTCGEFVRALGGNVVSVTPSAPLKTWFCAFPDGDRELSESELRREISERKIPRELLVWTEGMADWAIVSTLPAFQSHFRPEPPRKPGELLTKTVNGIEYRFRWCPAGSFMMGSPESEEDRCDDETQHKVTLTQGFWLLETEVTVGMFRSFVTQTGYASQGDIPWGGAEVVLVQDSKYSWQNPGFSQTENCPVTCVSWDDAQAFSEWLGKQIGLPCSLPTEAQWEYACRAGTTGAYAGNLDEMGWCYSNSGLKTHAVGQKKPNAWGLYDMHGNVWEWCLDWYDSNYYAASPTSDPLNSKEGSFRVNHGGSWNYSAKDCRSAYRGNAAPVNRISRLGFRPLLLVLSFPGSGS